MPPWAIPAILGTWGVVSSLVAYGYATGKLVGAAPTRLDIAAAEQRCMEAIRTASAEWRSERESMSARLTGEHAERRRSIDALDAALGTIRIDQARHDERLKTIEIGRK